MTAYSSSCHPRTSCVYDLHRIGLQRNETVPSRVNDNPVVSTNTVIRYYVIRNIILKLKNFVFYFSPIWSTCELILVLFFMPPACVRCNTGSHVTDVTYWRNVKNFSSIHTRDKNQIRKTTENSRWISIWFLWCMARRCRCRCHTNTYVHIVVEYNV